MIKDLRLNYKHNDQDSSTYASSLSLEESPLSSPDSFKSVDTHCHINLMVKHKNGAALFDTALSSEEISEAQVIIKEAETEGVNKIICVGTSLTESLNCLELARTYPNIYCSLGIHPNDATETWHEDLKTFRTILKDESQNPKENSKIVAIGECGFDFHYPEYNKNRQRDVFKAQIELALEFDKAIIIHTRDAGALVVDVLEEYKNESGLRGSMHCFSEDLEFAQRSIKLDFVLGIGGTVTYPKNTILRDVVKAVGLANIVLETDAPYLPPQHMRGKKNHPQYIKNIAEYIAQLLGVTYDEAVYMTTKNAERIFKFK
jgi:TatD DNase family protein